MEGNPAALLILATAVTSKGRAAKYSRKRRSLGSMTRLKLISSSSSKSVVLFALIYSIIGRLKRVRLSSSPCSTTDS